MPIGACGEIPAMIEVELLPAQYGDAIWLRYGPSEHALHHVLIDTGFEDTATLLRKQLRQAPQLAIDLLVLTHIDADHIEGSVHLLQDVEVAGNGRIRQVWFNGWQHIDSVAKAEDALGALQGEYFSSLVKERKIPWNDRFACEAVCIPNKGPLPVTELAGGMRLTLLSPTREKLRALQSYWVKDLKGKLAPGDERQALALLAEDRKYKIDALGLSSEVAALVARPFKEDSARANGSSIAFLAEYDGKRLLFTGDAHPSVLVASIDRFEAQSRPLPIDVFKVAHHGSCHNTSPELIERIRCKHVLISTNGKKFDHPDAECIARIVDAHRGRDLVMHFNYATEFTQAWNDPVTRKKYDYTVEYGAEGALTVSL
jgi:beta-lactamase superfamily II metal-dependent hydrolase